MTKRKIKVGELESGCFQMRFQSDDSKVDEYAELYESRDHWPFEDPIQVVSVDNGKRLIVWDGHHRLDAAKKVGAKTVYCNVERGTEDDAFRKALGANSSHGMPRSKWDLRKVVCAALDRGSEYQNMSIEELRKVCGIASKSTVHAYKKEWENHHKPLRVPGEVADDSIVDDAVEAEEVQSTIDLDISTVDQDKPVESEDEIEVEIGDEMPIDHKKKESEKIQSHVQKLLAKVQRYSLLAEKVWNSENAVTGSDVYSEQMTEVTKALGVLVNAIKKVTRVEMI